jgi:hypothetical protein
MVMRTYLDQCEEAGTEPVQETYRFCEILDGRVPQYLDGLNRWQLETARIRFRQQVLRELNRLVEQGVLVKRGYRNDLRFLTPAAAQAEDEQHAQLEKNLEERQARVKTAVERLTALGFEPYTGHGGVELDDEEWERLLDLAEDGQNANATAWLDKE